VALKLLKVRPELPAASGIPRAISAEAELLFRFRRAFRPSFVRCTSTRSRRSTARSLPYIVLEWLEGVTLDALIKQRNRDGLPAIPLRKLVRLLTPVARALERAHNFGARMVRIDRASRSEAGEPLRRSGGGRRGG